ncbi:hypothetical protein HPB48_016969 [Haemaphysalis longicornis]|uniref:Kelch repeat protein n=1 Tax=Haemaphysalis longicornis TaxID=44386 RepID=A0A9J6H394_HAELO|nr:hypothetical protein HPB48_016969 [Haemaphysalis longicornis]
MPAARCYVSVAVLQGYIDAMGGFDGEDRTSSCDRYDAKRNQCKLVASMNAVRSDACATAAAGRIYIMGDFTGREVLDRVECYDPSVDAWSYVMSMSSSPQRSESGRAPRRDLRAGWLRRCLQAGDGRENGRARRPLVRSAQHGLPEKQLRGRAPGRKHLRGLRVRRRYDGVARRAIRYPDPSVAQWPELDHCVQRRSWLRLRGNS